ncbi:MAG: hypothetical protein E7481_08475 [Ruminococcaceae bacterium]|nr:hypothetical protein [Oscillospiraceae bacterium]
MKKLKKNKKNSVSVLSGMILITAIIGCFLISKYGNTEEVETPKVPYSPPHNVTIPDLYNSSENIPIENIPTIVPSDGVTDSEGVNEEDMLPRDKYGLPYPQKERPEDVQTMLVQHTAKSGYEYFDNSVFLGDSVTLGLKNYTTKKRKTDSYFLGNAKFIAVGSYSVADTLTAVDSPDSIHSLYNGVITQPQDIIADMGVKRVFICLGLNDVGIYTKTEYLNNYSFLINRIRKAVPDIQIAILSVTPLTVEGERKILYNAKIDEYNNALAAFSIENGCYFIDVSTVLKDELGYLADELSSDNYCHLEPAAYDAWLEYMMTHCIPSPEEEAAMKDANGGAIHIDKGVPEVEGWEGSAGEP